jgi:hypothetical protein
MGVCRASDTVRLFFLSVLFGLAFRLFLTPTP